jgi:hypothetical protein
VLQIVIGIDSLEYTEYGIFYKDEFAENYVLVLVAVKISVLGIFSIYIYWLIYVSLLSKMYPLLIYIYYQPM